MHTPLPRDLEALHAPGTPRGPALHVVALDRGFGSIMGETWLVRTAAGLHAWTRDSRMDPFREAALASSGPLRVEGAGLQLSVRLREASGAEHVLAVPIHVERDVIERLTTPEAGAPVGPPAGPRVAAPEAGEARPVAPVVRDAAPEARPVAPVVRDAAPEARPVAPVVRQVRRTAPLGADPEREDAGSKRWVWLVVGLCGLGILLGSGQGDGCVRFATVAIVAVLVWRRWFASRAPDEGVVARSPGRARAPEPEPPNPDGDEDDEDHEEDAPEDPPLHAAAYVGDIDELRALLDAGADLGQRDGNGETALHRAASDEQEALELLLARGADARARDAAGRTPLHVSASWAATECVALLLGAGAEVDATDAEGATPLHHADGADVIAALLAAGADVHARDKGGDTPLHRASAVDDAEGVRRLVAAGADPEAKNDDGARPADLTNDDDVRAALGG